MISSILLAGIIIVPGMDMTYVMSDALAGLTATFGIMTRGAFHTAFGVFVVGMSQLIPQLYMPMLIIGALYMAWIGVSLARSTIVMDPVTGSAARSSRAMFAQAVHLYPQFKSLAARACRLSAIHTARLRSALVATMQFTLYAGLGLLAAEGRNAMTGKPQLTIWSGRIDGLPLTVAALFTPWRGWQAAWARGAYARRG